MKTVTKMNIIRLSEDDAYYPSVLSAYLGEHAPTVIAALGNLDLLQGKMLALFCSIRCPGHLILQTHDLAQTLREVDMTVISGFHSPVERECLTVLLRSSTPLVMCPARSLDRMRIPGAYRAPLEQGRLLLLSPFVEKPRRPTVQTALYRNRFVAALADQLFVAYAEQGSKTDQFCREVLAWGKPLYTLESAANAHLTALGAKPVRPDDVAEWITRCLSGIPRTGFSCFAKETHLGGSRQAQVGADIEW